MKCCYCNNEVTQEDIFKNLSYGFSEVCCEQCWKENDHVGKELMIFLLRTGVMIGWDKDNALLNVEKMREVKDSKNINPRFKELLENMYNQLVQSGRI